MLGIEVLALETIRHPLLPYVIAFYDRARLGAFYRLHKVVGRVYFVGFHHHSLPKIMPYSLPYTIAFR